MATFTYNHAVKINGKVIPANTPVEVQDESTAMEETTVESPTRSRAAKKKE